MAKNGNLHAAKAAKNDEFYTRYEDINAEINTLEHGYRPHFEGKIVYCNCDDPEWSNFWKFFKDRFHAFQMKKLISTHYEPDGSSSYKLEYDGVSVKKTEMEGNGDFRDAECIEILKEADIVVTNPPFSLFREYVAQLMEYKKSFIIIGNINAVTYKEFFPLLKEGKVWAGWAFNKTFEMLMPDNYELKGKAYIDEEGRKHGFIPAVAWYTNLDIPKRHEPLRLSARYYGYEKDYPKYDNYDAINVDKVQEIPCDYEPCWYKCPHAASCRYAQTEGKEDKALCEQACNGEMGVPITYLDKHTPEQFELVKFRKGDDDKDLQYTIEDCSQPVHVERETHGAAVLQNRHSQDAVSATESSECQSPLPIDMLSSNSGSSAQQKAKARDSQTDCGTNPVESLNRLSTEKENIRDFSSCVKCNGVMGCPITLLDKYCPEQFIILNANDYHVSNSIAEKSHGLIKDKEGSVTAIERAEQYMRESASELLAPGADGWHINGKRKYARIYVRKLGSYEDMVSRPIYSGTKVYRRIFIRRIKTI